MADNRVKGQEVQVIIVAGGVVQDQLTAFKSAELSFQTEVLTEGYLGETTDRRDTIFKGVKGSLELVVSSPQIFGLITAIIERARRRTPGLVVNIKMVINFPDGRRVRILVPDCAFGELPIGFGSRSDYGATTIPFEAAEAQII